MSGNMTFDNQLLKSFVERIETKNEEVSALNADLKEIYNEVKAAGYDPKYVKMMINLRKKDKDEIDEQDELLAMYRKALGI